ncbi:MAG: hypothetical protein JWN70_4064 [Planctomycetaceae bacterium]|nr:hypothetical protein [Planctomycetaceae bacterium]
MPGKVNILFQSQLGMNRSADKQRVVFVVDEFLPLVRTSDDSQCDAGRVPNLRPIGGLFEDHRGLGSCCWRHLGRRRCWLDGFWRNRDFDFAGELRKNQLLLEFPQ